MGILARRNTGLRNWPRAARRSRQPSRRLRSTPSRLTRIQRFPSSPINRKNRFLSSEFGRVPLTAPCRFFCDLAYLLSEDWQKPYGAGSRVPLREGLLNFRTSRLRLQSAWPGNFKTMTWDQVVSFSMVGELT